MQRLSQLSRDDQVDDHERAGLKILLDAHDYLWSNKAVPVADRLPACDLLYEVAAKILKNENLGPPAHS